LRVDWEQTVDFVKLTALTIDWWADYTAFERDDTVGDAYHEQRLTVKGGDVEWEKSIAFKPDPTKSLLKTYEDPQGKTYPLLKGLKGMRLRCDPLNFAPTSGGTSRKTELGLHDMSTGLMNNRKKISEQQYKTLGKGGDNAEKEIYTFMPLGYPEDQALFQILNNLAKRVRVTRPAFYELIRCYRARMTRIKLAAEHDMATNFSLASPNGYKMVDGQAVPKFRFSLIAATDVTAQDAKYLDAEGRGQLQKGLEERKKIVSLVKTTGDLLAARQQAALDYRNLVLDKLRYGEVVVSFRQHAGDFPMHAMFSEEDEGFIVGDIVDDLWSARQPQEIIPDRPPATI
jgi:hypothetical protein